MSPNIVCLGVHILDTIALPVDDVPKQQNSVRVQQILHAVGGTSAGVAMDIAHLGFPVSTIGVVGTDETGRFLLELMRAKGVNTNAVTTLSTEQTSSSILLVDSFGNRPAIHVRGVHAVVQWKDFELSPLTAARYVHLGGLDALSSLSRTAVIAQVRELRSRGAFVSLDFQSSAQHLSPELLEIVAEVNAFLPNDEQAAGLTGCTDIADMSRALLATGVEQVVITRGEKGIHFADRDRSIDVPAVETVVVDTTGCGDSVTAAYLTARAHGLDTHECLSLAAAAGAAVASGVGSLGALPSWAELCRRVGVEATPIGARAEGEQ